MVKGPAGLLLGEDILRIIEKARVFQKNIISALLNMAKPLTVWFTINWKILKEMGIPDHLTCFLRNLYTGQEATVRTGHGTTDWFQIGKGVHQGSTSMQSTSWETLGWKKHKLESRFPGEISITSDMQMTPPLWQKVKRKSKASWWRWKWRVKKLA